MAKNCKIISVCFADKGTASSEDIFELFKDFIEQEIKVDAGIPMDTLIINNDIDFKPGNEYLLTLSGQSTKNGEIQVFARPNVDGTFGAFVEAYTNLKDDYDYWLFSDYNKLILKDNYYSDAIAQILDSGKKAAIEKNETPKVEAPKVEVKVEEVEVQAPSPQQTDIPEEEDTRPLWQRLMPDQDIGAFGAGRVKTIADVDNPSSASVIATPIVSSTPNGKIGFVAFAPIISGGGLPHVPGGFGLASKEALEKIAEKNDGVLLKSADLVTVIGRPVIKKLWYDQTPEELKAGLAGRLGAGLAEEKFTSYFGEVGYTVAPFAGCKPDVLYKEQSAEGYKAEKIRQRIRNKAVKVISVKFDDAEFNKFQYAINKDKDVDYGIELDIIVVNNDVSYHKGNNFLVALNGIKTINGVIKVITRKNIGGNYGAFAEAYNQQKDEYYYWIFTDVDTITSSSDTYKKAIEQIDADLTAGFVAFSQISSEVPHYAIGGYGLSRKDRLDKVVSFNKGTLPVPVIPPPAPPDNGGVKVAQRWFHPPVSTESVPVTDIDDENSAPLIAIAEKKFTAIYSEVGYELVALGVKSIAYVEHMEEANTTAGKTAATVGFRKV